PMLKSLQRSRPFHCEAPACQARMPQATNCVTDPSRRMTKCAETSSPAMSRKYGCADRSSLPRKRSSIHSPPNSPGGSEMLWTTSREIASPSGRASQYGEGFQVAPAQMPAASRLKTGDRPRFPGWRNESLSCSSIRETGVCPRFSVDAKAVEAIAQRAEGDTQQLRGRGLVEARGLERLHDRLALDLVEEIVQ